MAAESRSLLKGENKRRRLRDAAVNFTNGRGESSGSAARFLKELEAQDLVAAEDAPTQDSIRSASKRERDAWSHTLPCGRNAC